MLPPWEWMRIAMRFSPFFSTVFGAAPGVELVHGALHCPGAVLLGQNVRPGSLHGWRGLAHVQGEPPVPPPTASGYLRKSSYVWTAGGYLSVWPTKTPFTHAWSQPAMTPRLSRR